MMHMSSPLQVLAAAGLQPDPWQRDFLSSRPRAALLLCSRQAGKSTTVAALALHEALYGQDRPLVLLLSPSLRQSRELFRKVLEFLNASGSAALVSRRSALRLEFARGGRIVSLPGQEGTVRGFSRVSLLVIDEAARVPDDLYYAVRPMLAVSRGRLVALSTPWGRRGWFYECFADPAGDFARYRVTAPECARISPEFLAAEQRALPPAWFRSEYLCEFEGVAEQLFPRELLLAALSPEVPPLFGAGAGRPAPGVCVVGLDLGQSRDYTALAVVERFAAPGGLELRLRHVQRLPLGLSYPRLVARLADLLRRPELGPAPTLVVDKTGVGAPVVDMLLEAGLDPYAVVIHGGDSQSRHDRDLRLPQRDLVANLQVQLQTGGLRLAAGLPDLELLLGELENFQVSLGAAGHDRYGAGRPGVHDDLVFALALALWGAGRLAPDPQPFLYIPVPAGRAGASRWP